MDNFCPFLGHKGHVFQLYQKGEKEGRRNQNSIINRPFRHLSDRKTKNRDHHLSEWQALQELTEIIKLGGGQKRIDREHDRGKWTARERIDKLIDSDSTFYELGLFTGFGMYEEDGGCPAGGTVMGISRVSGRLCVIVANDATVKAGAWFPITAKKNLRAQEIALENHLPIIYLVDSAGVFLPMQDEIFPDKEHFGRIFRNNAQLSSKGIPQLAAIMGSCVAGGAYLPIMSDESLIVEGSGSVFLAGPFLVKAAIGEDVDKETLGGAATHSKISGVTDHLMKDEASCLERIRELVGRQAKAKVLGFDRQKATDPSRKSSEILDIFPASRTSPFDVADLLNCIVDDGSWIGYKEEYGKTLECGYARIDGWSVGIVANQRKVVKTESGEMQVGGVIYSDSANKAARFVLNCNQKGIPLVFLQDVSGFMVGSRAEHGGIIKDGAKLVNAVANSVVPKFTIVIGNSYGAGNYAMCGKAYDPRLMLAWPSAQIAVMGGKQAAKTLAQIEFAKLKRRGEEPDETAKAALLSKIENRYAEQTKVTYAASRLWVDEVINPLMTRDWISLGIDMANHQPELAEFKTGVIQT